MAMDSRKMRILRAITDDYIATAEPVGSRTIARKYDLKVSPATIRNDMSDLEELGYLDQPHTSAGRVPSDKGYRYYVDELMSPSELSEYEREGLRGHMIAKQRAMEALIHRAARALSDLSSYTAVVMAPRISESIIRSIHLTPIGEYTFLMVLVSDPGFVHHKIVDSPVPIDAGLLISVSEKLNRLLVGKSIREMTRSVLSHLQESLKWQELYSDVVELVLRSLTEDDSERFYLDGALHLFEQPEFNDVERAKDLLNFLEQPDTLADLIGNVPAGASIHVTIGKEHSRAQMQQCSMVTATYSVGNTVIGTVGVIGPTRLDYEKVVGVVRGMADALSEVLTEMSTRS